MSNPPTADPYADLAVGDPVPDGWFDDDTSPACLSAMPHPSRPDLQPFICTRIEHDRRWSHIATGGPVVPGQYVHSDGTVHPADEASVVGGVLAKWWTPVTDTQGGAP